ncbi:hypothetical protein AB205_0061690 [Aquarana catesbeiana]|uniref:Uncharacterized protein n=1 Tax=Aquarana catesbeiana TaxID=8400 RepID=A0A2G9S0N2_AQUCT|nr:hypothetical protein AB205_0061690 [Aquarana catesbeiana]
MDYHLYELDLDTCCYAVLVIPIELYICKYIKAIIIYKKKCTWLQLLPMLLHGTPATYKEMHFELWELGSWAQIKE